jgi:aminoglycoside/choline kinase family phosphotransferase
MKIVYFTLNLHNPLTIKVSRLMTTSDIRAKLIQDWLENDLGLEIKDFQTASSDASFRRYFRVTHPQGQHIVMDAPPDLEDIRPFIKVATLLEKSQVNVPHIHQQNLDKGFLLLEDFGSQNLLDQLNPENASALYEQALAELLKLQTNTCTQTSDLPHYDEALLKRELELFYDWFAQQLLNKTLPDSIKNSLNQFLIASALEQPQVCVHRDYHSRNLMYQENAAPGVIDFQDAVIGAITYDLVSLLRDCYISWTQPQLDEWIEDYFRRLTEAGLVDCSLAQFNRWFDLMGLQRHLKAIGIFARLNLRDGKSGYLKDIPRTMNYVVQVCQKYPELSEFYTYLKQEILPIYQDYL